MKWTIRKYLPGFFPIEKRTTDHNYLEVNKRQGHLVLDSVNVNYSFGALHRVFQQAFASTKENVASFHNALLLGFGGGSVAFILQHELGFRGSITGVEIDQKVIELSQKYFGLDKIRNLEIEIADAYDFVFSETQQYDVIVVDIFIDHLIPEKFDKKEFLIQLERILEKGGILLYNRMSLSYHDRKRVQSFRETFSEVFEDVVISKEFSIGSTNIIFYVKK